MVQRARDQYISIYEQAKKPEKPKPTAFEEAAAFVGKTMMALVGFYVGMPIFCEAFKFAMCWWGDRSYRCW